MRLPSPRRRHKNRQAGPVDGAVVHPTSGKRARAGLAQRFKGALVRRQVARAIGTIPASAALAVGLAIGVCIGVALVLGTLAELIREANA